MTGGQQGALAGLLVLGAAAAAAALLSTPWQVLATPPGGPTPVDPARDFTPEQRERQRAFHRLIRPTGYASTAIGLGLSLVLGLTPAGARLVGALARPLGGGWAWQVLLGSVVLSLLGQLATLPLAAYRESVLRRYRLSTRSWPAWAGDLARAFAVGTVLGWVGLLPLYAVVRAAPQTWWAWAAAGGAALVVLLSFGYPAVVEPVFNRFGAMPDGPLRDSLLELAATDGVPVREVLVADASRRSTALNAYVSGLGATRRIVVYDTLLDSSTPQEVRLVVAHELGHARSRDVLSGTVLGALGVAAAMCGAYLVLGWPWLLHRAGVDSLADARSLPLLLAVAGVAATLGSPLGALLSRRIEARADVHALDLTRDPATFVAAEQRLCVTNLAELDPGPVSYALFATHPTGPQRIALARDWQRLNPA